MPDFLPAAGRLPLSFYDLGARLTMREGAWRPDLAERVAAATPAGGSVLELGAGTGSLTRLLREALPAGTSVTAVDPDADALAIAVRKVPDPGITWAEGRAEKLPVPDRSQDALVTSLVLHHLPEDAKRAAVAEAQRVLRPGGLLLSADFGPPQDPVMGLAFRALRLVDGPTTSGHAEGIVRQLVEEAGFNGVNVARRVRTAVGSLEVLEARAP